MATSPFIWLIAGFIIMALEILVPGFILFWFGFAAFLTSIISFLNLIEEALYLWICFFCISAATLILWHFYLKNISFFKRNTQDEYRDISLANLKGIVITEIKINKPGRIKLNQAYHGISEWKAEAKEDIALNEEVSVLDSDGIKLIVEKIK